VPEVKGGGDVERITFAEWIAKQPPEVQDEALGPTRAELFRQGGLKLDRFADDERIYTLDQLRQIHPEAFSKAAGIDAGPGYSPSAKLGPDGVIYTNDVHDAVRALWEGKQVNLDQPKQVSVLLDRLARVARDMEEAGNEAPNFNLCRVTVSGMSLFCADTKGFPRIQMPQLKGIPLPGSRAALELIPDERGETDISPYFRDFLAARGYSIEDDAEKASFLRATQNELNGTKVAALAKIEREEGLADERLFVSRDDYILDGHHRWAATVGVDFDDNVPGDIRMDVARVDTDIITLMKEARDFAGEWGIPQQGIGTFAGAPIPGSTVQPPPAEPFTPRYGPETNATTGEPAWPAKVEYYAGGSLGFPILREHEFRITGGESSAYNCAGDACGIRQWVWPGEENWPEAADHGNSIASFDALLTEMVGGTITENQAPEPGHVKLAVYTLLPDGTQPTHMMRQLPTGEWMSKMGSMDTLVLDNVHDLENGVYGRLYRMYDVPLDEWLTLKDIIGDG
jgi:hypothetical protein